MLPETQSAGTTSRRLDPWGVLSIKRDTPSQRNGTSAHAPRAQTKGALPLSLQKLNATTRRDLLAVAGATALMTTAGFGFNRLHAKQSSETITQTAKFNLNKDKIDEAVAKLKELVAAVEEKEPGVLAYICHQSPTDAAEPFVFFYEVYENEAALAAHGQQPHLMALREAFGAGLFLPPVEIVRVERIAGFYRA